MNEHPRRAPAAVQLVITVIETYALAECIWYIITDGRSHLYEVLAEYLSQLRERVEYRAQVLDTLRMIRRLPEQ